MILITTMTSENGKNGKEYTMIPVLPSTKDELASLMPKSWDWDRCIKELTEMWKNQQGKVVKSGKPAQNNQTS